MDTERLDWLDKHPNAEFYCHGPQLFLDFQQNKRWVTVNGETARECIDEAMKHE